MRCITKMNALDTLCIAHVVSKRESRMRLEFQLDNDWEACIEYIPMICFSEAADKQTTNTTTTTTTTTTRRRRRRSRRRRRRNKSWPKQQRNMMAAYNRTVVFAEIP
jgi:hypothetical protein